MASSTVRFLFLSVLLSFIAASSAGRKITDQSSGDGQYSQLLQYHKGPLLSGKISINLVWYGDFKPTQRAIIADFITSLTSPAKSTSHPSVAAWWTTIGKYYRRLPTAKRSASSLSLGAQTLDGTYSLGKSLTSDQIKRLASKSPRANAVTVVLTAADVAVEGFCMNRCGTHGTIQRRHPYIWVGNSEKQCPGLCAWPFHQPIYGPQGPPLVGPNNDVGLDGMVINLAALLAGTATNPFGNGFYQGPKEAPLEAASACPGVYGKGAYPGYAGELLVEPSSGASYNANGAGGRKYLLPALFDPSTSRCSTLV